MQIQNTKNLDPGRFELGTTLSEPNRCIPISSEGRCHHQVIPYFPKFINPSWEKYDSLTRLPTTEGIIIEGWAM